MVEGIPHYLSLAQRLGYDRNARLLIINCDDLGVSHAANMATLRAMTEGIATDASLMVPCPWAPEAARLFRDLPVGVHLTLTSEYRDYRWRGLTSGSSLSNRDGFLHRTTAEALATLTLSDAYAECCARIETALTWGVDVTHPDAHMDVIFSRPDLFALYLDLGTRFRLPVRVPSQSDQGKGAFDAPTRACERNTICPDNLIDPWPHQTRTILTEALPRLPPGISEIFTHPTDDTDELHAYDHKFTHICTHDAACLTDPSLRLLLEQHDIRRINYRALRDALRNTLSA